MQKITPFLWFNVKIEDITDFYASVFNGSKVLSMGALNDTPSGAVQTARFEIFGQEFVFMAAGPYAPFNPTVSFIISCGSIEEVDDLWKKLSDGGRILMELARYPFAEKYGWVEDHYGVSWQVMFSPTMRPAQKIIPTLMFAGAACGRAREAVDFYTSVFPHSKIEYVMPYDGTEPTDDERAKTKHAAAVLGGVTVAFMDSGKKSPLTFQQGISFVVNCDTQEEVDYYWEKLTHGGKEIQCGWLTDMFGVPWQVVPRALGRMLESGAPGQIARVAAAFMKMKKFDIKVLEEAFGLSTGSR